jgi:hypothetical protein
MSTTLIDCKTLVPLAYNPSFHPCWGRRAFPSTMAFSAGPSTPIPPNTSCNTGWPTSVITGSLARTGPCNFSWSYSSGSFTILFAWTLSTYPVTCSINQAEMYPNWSLNNLTGIPTGTCSQDPATGIVTMTFAGIISDGFCNCPITVSYTG